MARPDKTRSNQTPGSAASPAVPARKISETILDFGAPLIFDLDTDQPIEIVHATMTIVITIWNAHVMAMPVWGKPDVLDQLEDLLRSPRAAPELIQTYHDLSQRRHEHFASDPRSVGEWNVTIDAARLRLACTAHVPPSLMTHGA